VSSKARKRVNAAMRKRLEPKSREQRLAELNERHRQRMARGGVAAAAAMFMFGAESTAPNAAPNGGEQAAANAGDAGGGGK
jgi:hypothetical protein